MTGIKDFRELIIAYRWLLVWVIPSTLVPFVAQLAVLSPPWPPAISLLTALMQLLALIIAYQLLKGANKRIVTTVICASVIACLLTSIIYLILISQLTFSIPPTNERGVKGFQCTHSASIVFASKCPRLGEDELRTAEYEASRLWTLESITAARILIVAFWLTSFSLFAGCIASFIVFQRDQARFEFGLTQSPSSTNEPPL